MMSKRYEVNYYDCRIMEFDTSDIFPVRDISESFETFEEAKESLIFYFDKCISDAKVNLSFAKKLKINETV